MTNDFDVNSSTSHDLIKNALQHVLDYGKERTVWGGTIPEINGDKGVFGDKNDFDRVMIEATPMTMCLTNPLARWCDWSSHWVGITLRETEDSLQGYNPGEVLKYSKLYRRWLNEKHYFNYTYGERMAHYPYNPNAFMFDKDRLPVLLDFNQFQKTIDLLKQHPTTRKACISTWYPPVDVGNPYVPCNVFFQLRVVDDKLEWITVIRSLDILRGLTENIFMFTIWQEYASFLLGVPLGNYITVALNPHIYKEQIDKKQHIQKIEDCYKKYVPQPAGFPFPSNEFEAIDASLFQANNIDQAVEFSTELEDYWSNWKLALIAEWVRLHHKDNEKAKRISDLITNEFKYPVQRRL